LNLQYVIVTFKYLQVAVLILTIIRHYFALVKWPSSGHYVAA